MRTKFKKGIILASTGESIFTSGVLVQNIKIFQPDIEVFYIVTDFISSNDRKLLEELAFPARLQIVPFTKDIFQQRLNKFNKSIKYDSKSPSWKRYSFMSFGRFEALNLLEECEKILYLDFDMFVQKPFHELYNLKENIGITIGGAIIKDALGFSVPNVDCTKLNLQSSIILFNSTIKNPQKVYEDIYRFLSENFTEISNSRLPDQGVISVVFFRHQLSICQLDSAIYSAPTTWIKSDNATIIHAFGSKTRFWNNKLICAIRPNWLFLYQAWVARGGMPYVNGWVLDENIPLGGGWLYKLHLNYIVANKLYLLLSNMFEVSINPRLNDKILINVRIKGRDYALTCIPKTTDAVKIRIEEREKTIDITNDDAETIINWVIKKR